MKRERYVIPSNRLTQHGVHERAELPDMPWRRSDIKTAIRTRALARLRAERPPVVRGRIDGVPR